MWISKYQYTVSMGMGRYVLLGPYILDHTLCVGFAYYPVHGKNLTRYSVDMAPRPSGKCRVPIYICTRHTMCLFDTCANRSADYSNKDDEMRLRGRIPRYVFLT